MTGHIFLEGEIGDTVTIDSVRADIANYPQATAWDVHINSNGGDVDTGYAIGNILSSLKNTTANIGALCASIATYDAHCCDKIVMGPAGDFTIHLPTGDVGGTAQDHRNAAERLDRIKTELVNRYMKRVGKKGITVQQVSVMIDKETSMSPSEALAMGFVDTVQEKLKAVAKIKLKMENTLTREEATSFFDKMDKKIDKFFSKMFKNQVQIALADGTMATSDAASPDALVGSNVLGGDGQPLPDGPTETADGYIITCVGGKVTAYEPANADQKPDPNKALETLQKENAALKEQLAAKNSEAAKAVQATAKIEAEFKNEFKNLKTELEELKTKTFGESGAGPKNPKFKDQDEDGGEIFDPMKELADSFLTSRTTPFNR